MNIYIANSYKDYIDFTAKHILHFLEKKQEKKKNYIYPFQANMIQKIFINL
ncbi:hypothetical protein [Brachyspira murdochii]|uniref:hypothetical protein n=1 Tax=Brachyspira murdochii TaxID=84378 RepID=UPI002157E660|nr:hypothetical protein [Brachyspira murdochii]